MSLAHVHLEVFIVIGYVAFLLLVLMGIEWLGRLSHESVRRFKTVGFTYQPHTGAWQCSEGQSLWLDEVDYEAQVARYRARAEVCNVCGSKHYCTDSNEGRELTHSLKEWPYSEVSHFHRGLALTMAGVAALFLGVEFIRHHHTAEEVILLTAAAAAVFMASRRMMQHFWGTPANFPEAKRTDPSLPAWRGGFGAKPR